MNFRAPLLVLLSLALPFISGCWMGAVALTGVAATSASGGGGGGGGGGAAGASSGVLRGTVTEPVSGALRRRSSAAEAVRPSVGAVVTVEGTNLSAKTDSDGNFVIVGIPPGAHEILVEKDTDGDGVADLRYREEKVQVSAGAGASLGKRTVRKPGSLSGLVLLEGHATGNVGVQVFIPGTPHRALTDDNGQYAIRGLPAGTYEVIARKAGYLSDTAADVEVLSGQSAAVADLTLQLDTAKAKGNISGNARLIGAASSAGVTVSLIGTSRTDTAVSSGAYSLKDVPLGVYTLEARMQEYSVGRIENVVVRASTNTVASTLYLSPVSETTDSDGDGVANNIDEDDDNDGFSDAEEIAAGTDPSSAAQRPTGTITGTVSLGGQPSAGNVVVELGGISKVLLTDPTGAFTFNEVPPGTYTLSMVKTDFDGASITGVAVVAGQVTDAGAVTLSAKVSLGSLTGTAMLQGQADHGGIGILVQGVASATTDASGAFTASNLPQGRYRVIASFDGYGNGVVSGAEVTSGNATALGALTLVPTSVSLSVTGGVGTVNVPRVSLDVSALNLGSGAWEMLLSEDAGFFGAQWIAFQTPYVFDLSGGDGLKTVYAKFRDLAASEAAAATGLPVPYTAPPGHQSAVATTTVTVDSLPPSAPVVDPVVSPTNKTTITLSGMSEADAAITISGGAASVTTAADATGAWSQDVALNPGATNTLEVTVSDAAGNVSSPRQVVVEQASVMNVPAMLAFTAQPTGVLVGVVLSPAIRVEVRDAFGTRISGATNAITIALGNDPSGGTALLSGTLTASAVGGVATFSDLAINTAGAGYTLSASASGLTSAVSASFTITKATLSVVSTNPASGVTNWMPFDPIIIKFSVPIDVSRISNGDGTFTNNFDSSFFRVVEQGGAQAVSGTVVFSEGDQTAAWWPEIPGATNGIVHPDRAYVTQGKTYTLAVSANTKGAPPFGVVLGQDYVLSFSTTPAGFMPVRSHPFPGETNVGVNSGIEVEFSQGLDLPNSNNGWPIELRQVGGSLHTTGVFNFISPTVFRDGGRTADPTDAIAVSYLPNSPLLPNTVYQVTVPATGVCAAQYFYNSLPANPVPPVADPAGSTLVQLAQWTFTTGGSGALNDTTRPWAQDPSGAGASSGAFVPAVENHPTGTTFSFSVIIPEPVSGMEVRFSEMIDPHTVSLTSVRYSPFSTNVAFNLNEIPGVTCGGGLFSNGACVGLQLQPPIPGIYRLDNSKLNSAGSPYTTLHYIPDKALGSDTTLAVGLSADSVHVELPAHASNGAGSAILDQAGNPFDNNLVTTGGTPETGLIFSVQ